MATSSKEILPPPLDATGVQPPLFDGTTRLYTSYTCPFAQRVWITRNCKGLQEKIKLVPLNLQNRPAWYKDVYPPNKVPSLEHNGKIIGESLDLIKYVDSNFEGPSLFPHDSKKKKKFGEKKKFDEKKKFGEKLFSDADTFVTTVFPSFKGDLAKEIGPAFDYLEKALHKFNDGPFFLGQFSLVDIAYIPFVERFQKFFSEVFKIDITSDRPKLAAWIKELNKIDACTQTKTDPKELNEDPEKKFCEELFSYKDTFVTTVFSSFKGDPAKEIGPAFDYLEKALRKFKDGPFFLGQFSMVDIAYITFVERFQIFLSEVFKIDITTGRPKLAAWIKELNKIDAYTQTKPDPKEVIGKIIGDSNFNWSLLFPDDKKKFVEDLFSDINEFAGKLCSFQGNSAGETKLRRCHQFGAAVGAVLMLPALPALLPALPVLLPALPALMPALLPVLLPALSALPVGLPVASGAAGLIPPALVVPCIETQKPIAAVFDYLETTLQKFKDGPFFLGQFSLVDISCFTFVERFKILLPKGRKIDSKSDWPKLAAWIEEVNKITQTKTDPKEPVELNENRVLPQKK